MHNDFICLYILSYSRHNVLRPLSCGDEPHNLLEVGKKQRVETIHRNSTLFWKISILFKISTREHLRFCISIYSINRYNIHRQHWFTLQNSFIKMLLHAISTIAFQDIGCIKCATNISIHFWQISKLLEKQKLSLTYCIMWESLKSSW